MTTFVQASSVFRSLCGLLWLLLFGAAILLGVQDVRRKRWISVGILMLTGGGAYIGFETAAVIENQSVDGPIASFWVRTLGSIPDFGMVLLLAATLGMEIVLAWQSWQWGRNHIEARSIKAAIDSMPVGFCYADPSGQIYLKNREIDRFCILCSGKPLLHANEFYDILSKGTLRAGLTRSTLGDYPVILCPDGKCIHYVQTTIQDKKKNFQMMVTSDLSDIYSKVKTLSDQQETVQKLNRQLSEYNRSIISAISEKETLNARIKIHDELGADLLLAKKLLLSGGTSEEFKTLSAQLQQSMNFLKKEAKSKETDKYAQLMETAEKLGVWIDFQGKLTEDSSLKEILVTAIHECLTNMLRYAHGDCLKVETVDKRTSYQIHITNNGDCPKEEIIEKGGLLYLRGMVHQAGGTMTTASLPVFSLTIRLPQNQPKFAE